MSKVRPLRKGGAIPKDYTGPVYWRVCQSDLIDGADWHPLKWTDSRLKHLFIDRYESPGMTIFNSGEVFDEEGQLLPIWHTPIKAEWERVRPMRVEYCRHAKSVDVSERVFDAIQSIEPNTHHVFPVDVACLNGKTERRYLMFPSAESVFYYELDREASNLKPGPNPQIPYEVSTAFTGNYMAPFLYLSPETVGERHWFRSWISNDYFSPQLWSLLAPMGDIFDKYHKVFPMGLADRVDANVQS